MIDNFNFLSYNTLLEQDFFKETIHQVPKNKLFRNTFRLLTRRPKLKNLYNLKSLSLDDILSILKRASEFKAGAVADFSGKIVANLFFEPSTRTQNSRL